MPDPDVLAGLHAKAMTVQRPWSVDDFDALLSSPGVFFVPSSCLEHTGERARGAVPLSPPAKTQSAQDLAGFALGRVVLDEAELLTLAVAPAFQRQGVGAVCLALFETSAIGLGAKTAHLEVAATNVPALALYRNAGWQRAGLRRAYYQGAHGRIDAILMQKMLNPASGSDFSLNTQDSY